MNRPRVLISDVAEAAGVSASAVSLALSGRPGVSEETRARVAAIAAELGYRRNRHARALRAGATPTLAIIIPDVTNPFYAEIVVGVEEAARARGWDVLLYNVQLDPERERAYLERTTGEDLEGIIYVPLTTIVDDEPELVRRIASGPPLVLIGEAPHFDAERPIGVGAVAVDNHAGGRMIARHFADVGRSRAAVFGPPRDVPAAMARIDGFLDECAMLGIDVVAQQPTSWTRLAAGAVQSAVDVLAADRSIDCFFAGNDVVAIQVMTGLRDRGIRVPGDVAVCGFDGISWSALSSPTLTTVVQPSADTGVRAVGILADARINPRREWVRVTLPVMLEVRGSTTTVL